MKNIESVVIKIRNLKEEKAYVDCEWEKRDNFIIIYPKNAKGFILLAAATDRVEYIYYKNEVLDIESDLKIIQEGIEEMKRK